jgi:hypothetical protein
LTLQRGHCVHVHFPAQGDKHEIDQRYGEMNSNDLRVNGDIGVAGKHTFTSLIKSSKEHLGFLFMAGHVVLLDKANGGVRIITFIIIDGEVFHLGHMSIGLSIAIATTAKTLVVVAELFVLGMLVTFSISMITFGMMRTRNVFLLLLLALSGL